MPLTTKTAKWKITAAVAFALPLLGGTLLAGDNLAGHADALAQIGAALAPGGTMG